MAATAINGIRHSKSGAKAVLMANELANRYIIQTEDKSILTTCIYIYRIDITSSQRIDTLWFDTYSIQNHH